jgi:hypothetical protein
MRRSEMLDDAPVYFYRRRRAHDRRMPTFNARPAAPGMPSYYLEQQRAAVVAHCPCLRCCNPRHCVRRHQSETCGRRPPVQSKRALSDTRRKSRTKCQSSYRAPTCTHLPAGSQQHMPSIALLPVGCSPAHQATCATTLSLAGLGVCGASSSPAKFRRTGTFEHGLLYLRTRTMNWRPDFIRPRR